MVLALLEFAFVVLLNRLLSPDKKNLHGGIQEIRAFSEATMWSGRKIDDQDNSSTNGLEMKDGHSTEGKMIKVLYSMPHINVIDLISFSLYISLFVFFNVVYWIR